MTPFHARRGGVAMSFGAGEAELLRDLADQLVELLAGRSAETAGEGDPGDVLLAQLGIGGGVSAPLDPAVARLLPDAYRGDAGAASKHRHLTERGLIDRKVGNAQAVIASLDLPDSTLGDAQVQSWLRTLTDLRLTMAARLGIERDGDEGRIETEFDLALQAAYDWLGYLQGTLVEAIE